MYPALVLLLAFSAPLTFAWPEGAPACVFRPHHHDTNGHLVKFDRYKLVSIKQIDYVVLDPSTTLRKPDDYHFNFDAIPQEDGTVTVAMQTSTNFT